MNRSLSVVTIALAAIALTGCVADASSTALRPSVDSSGKRLGAGTLCNIGERYDAGEGEVRARYDHPADADYVQEHYGDWVANQSCSDAQIIAWQQLRRETGESDQICRIVYESSLGMVYPIGCAVPVMVVTDASR